MKRFLSLLLTLLMILPMHVSCGSEGPAKPDLMLNGVHISEYTIVYSTTQPDYNKNAAYYIRDRIEQITGVQLEIKIDMREENPHEILVGETQRPLSQVLDADTRALEFAFLSNETSVAMEADYFVIAAAAYYFTEQYLNAEGSSVTVPKDVHVSSPIVETPDNFILLIGDGMGPLHTNMMQYAENSLATPNDSDAFYGYLLPVQGLARTDSLSGVTDSAAAGTALATGYKTINAYVGMNEYKTEIPSLTELANSIGMATAVMSTEVITGATPAAFSAHALNRKNTIAIKRSQELLTSTILKSLEDSYDEANNTYEIKTVLDTLGSDKDGFFMMYEEAYIDKHSHNNDIEKAQKAMLRFNQAIGQFMEYAFYHPNTFVLITADHETGDLQIDQDGNLKYNSEDHTGKDVCVFAYGLGDDLFFNVTVENVQIPKTIAKMWGVKDFGDQSSPYAALGN